MENALVIKRIFGDKIELLEIKGQKKKKEGRRKKQSINRCGTCKKIKKK